MNESKDEILRQLSFLDPMTRVQELLKQGFQQEAQKAISEMIEGSSLLYFQHPHRGAGFKLITPLGNQEFVVCAGRKTDDLTDLPRYSFELEALKKVLGWDETQYSAFIVSIFNRAITINPTQLKTQIAQWAGSWEIMATAKAMEQFIPQGHEMRQSVERWCLRAWFADESYISGYFDTEMQERYLSKRIPKNHHHFGDHRYLEDALRWETDIAEAIMERMKVLGMSEDEIREDFFSWLERFVGHLNPQLLVGVANATIFRHVDRDRRGDIMSHMVDQVIEGVLEGYPLYHPFIVAKLCDAGMLHGVWEKAQCHYRHRAAMQLAKGHIGLVSEVTGMLGHRIFGWKNRCTSNKPELKFNLGECAAEAFDLAWRKERYGIAAALVNQFGAKACVSEACLRDKATSLVNTEKDGEKIETKLAELVAERKAQVQTVANLAKLMGQPIRLNYELQFVPAV